MDKAASRVDGIHASRWINGCGMVMKYGVVIDRGNDLPIKLFDLHLSEELW